MLVGSPTGNEQTQGQQVRMLDRSVENDRFGSSSPEPLDVPPSRYSSTTRDRIKIPGIRRPSAQSIEYSGDELSPGYSDFSDTPSQSLAQPSRLIRHFHEQETKAVDTTSNPLFRPSPRTTTGTSSLSQKRQPNQWLSFRATTGQRESHLAWLPPVPEDQKRSATVEAHLGGSSAEESGLLQERRGVCSEPDLASVEYNQCGRD